MWVPSWARAKLILKPSSARLEYRHAGFNEAVPRMSLLWRIKINNNNNNNNNKRLIRK